MDFDTIIRREYVLACRFLAGHDFYEGIRTVVVDKDKAPRWQPDCLALVSDAAVAEYFAPQGKELTFS
ncbi:MAG: enoyl-CoA hydratase/isomerase family protein [Rhodospirillaceae bacterium]|nr:enoyl-CoA hydratase/isomerase family protein [Rhodospirillales bacterium]